MRIYWSDILRDIYLDWDANYVDKYEDIRFEQIMNKLKEEISTETEN